MKLIGEYCLDDSRYRKANYLFQSIALKRISPPSYTTLLILGLYSHPIPSHLLVTPIAILICRFFFWFVVFNLRLLDFMFIVLRQLPVLLQCCFISCHDFIHTIFFQSVPWQASASLGHRQRSNNFSMLNHQPQWASFNGFGSNLLIHLVCIYSEPLSLPICLHSCFFHDFFVYISETATSSSSHIMICLFLILCWWVTVVAKCFPVSHPFNHFLSC